VRALFVVEIYANNDFQFLWLYGGKANFKLEKLYTKVNG